MLAGVWVGSQFHPRMSLKRGATQKGGGAAWIDDGPALNPTSDGFGHYLARGKSAFALVLSDSCEMDKRGGKVPVLVAPVISLTVVGDEATRETIRNERRYAFFPVDALAEQIDASYVDFRAISYVPRQVLDDSTRVASGDPLGIERLTAHLVGFFTRISLRELRTPA